MRSSPEFEADVRFLSREEGGRQQPAVQGLYRPDIHWDDDPSETLWMIHPRFFGLDGHELADGSEVPQTCRARFYLITAYVRDELHQHWLYKGAKFHISEGSHRVAAGTVTTVLSVVNKA